MIKNFKELLFGIRVQGEKVNDEVSFKTTLPTEPLPHNETWIHIFSITK